ncbi:uncharacterized protein LOC108047735 [Drosophila rhopaloa]|uniref:Uncharacterized protein LOC108047735 n=1 Tax=Drosophila rhopaloa TaxID=1041015 RepID=A0A6P4FDF4_DRORH|nr:uncharacterized protein LOC108047735 [Drosophila rhopaloa]
MSRCVLCRSSEDDEIAFGVIHQQEEMMVHHNCLYLSSNLIQRGNERNGILSFLKEDILAEARRCRLLSCCYCHRGGANIGCCESGCRRTFHTKCGVENLALNQFRDTYRSYCNLHVPNYRQRPSSATEHCVICQDLLVAAGCRFSVVTMIQSPCCRNGWYHRNCLQAYANTAGYFFKCPLCNNSDVFLNVALMGISVPNHDAVWETEPDAFAEQFHRDQTCTAVNCTVAEGRTGDVTTLLYCTHCGSNPVHINCKVTDGSYVCAVCSVVSPGDESSLSSAFSSTETITIYAQLQVIHTRITNSDRDDSDTETEDDEDLFRRVVASASEAASLLSVSTNRSPVTPVVGRGLAEDVVSSSAGSELSAVESSTAIPPGRRSRAFLDRSSRAVIGSLATALSGFEEIPRPRAGRRSAARSTSRAQPRRSSSRLQALKNQENTKPDNEDSAGCSSSNSAAPTQRSTRPRRTMPARMPEAGQKETTTDAEKKNDEDKEKEHEPKKRRGSPSPTAQPAGRRFLRSMSPGAVTSRSNGMTLRRRTMANPSHPLQGNLDVSCVANRTRKRLPAHLANQK